jgi:hypothetical protein
MIPATSANNGAMLRFRVIISSFLHKKRFENFSELLHDNYPGVG